MAGCFFTYRGGVCTHNALTPREREVLALLGKIFVEAGLAFPTIMGETVVGGGTGSYIYAWVANTLISVIPRLESLGLTLPPGMPADHTLAQLIEAEAVHLGSQILAPTQFGAWTRSL